MNKGVRFPRTESSVSDPPTSIPKRRHHFGPGRAIDCERDQPAPNPRARLCVLRMRRMLQMLCLLLGGFRMLQQLSSDDPTRMIITLVTSPFRAASRTVERGDPGFVDRQDSFLQVQSVAANRGVLPVAVKRYLPTL